MGRRSWQFQSRKGASTTGLRSSSQGWRARRRLNSEVRKRSVYLESVLARLIYRSLCKTHQQALNGSAETRLDFGKSDFAAHLAAGEVSLEIRPSRRRQGRCR